MPKMNAVEVDSKHYESESQAARELGLKRSTLVSRVNKGNRVASIGEVPDRKVEVEGQWFPDVRAAASHFGVNYSTFVSRLKRGLTGRRLTSTAKHSKKQSMIVEGKSYPSVTVMLRELGICQTSYNRYIKMGLTPQESVEVLLSKKRSKAKVMMKSAA